MIRVCSHQCPDVSALLVLETTGTDETEALAARFADLLVPGSVVSLTGDLGAGKTAFTRGLARGLACRGQVASPTFTLLREHPPAPGGLALYHFDVYRLDDANAAAAFVAMGLNEYFDAGGVCVIEWGDRIASLLPERTVQLQLTRPSAWSDNLRRLQIVWPDRQDQLKRLVQIITEAQPGSSEVVTEP